MATKEQPKARFGFSTGKAASDWATYDTRADAETAAKACGKAPEDVLELDPEDCARLNRASSKTPAEKPADK